MSNEVRMSRAKFEKLLQRAEERGYRRGVAATREHVRNALTGFEGYPRSSESWPPGKAPETLEEKLATPIEDLNPSVRLFNALRNAGIGTVGDIMARRYSDILDIKNLGDVSLKELLNRLRAWGLELND